MSQRLEVVDAGGATASFAGGYYLALRAAMNSAPNAALPNACTSTYGTPYSGFTTAICNQTQDNGFAMLLAKNVPGGESMVVKFNTSFGPLPGLTLTKSGSIAGGKSEASVGDVINYSFLVKNTGLIPTTGIAIDDAMLADAGVTATCPTTTLAPSASTTCTASYTVTAADVEAQQPIQNTAIARGLKLATPDRSDPSYVSINVAAPVPGLNLSKAGVLSDTNSSGQVDGGDTIAYTFTAKNTGTAPLTAVKVNDAKLSGSAIDCVATLAVGATASCTPTQKYTLTAADITAGKVDNTASGSALFGATTVNTTSNATSTVTFPVKPTVNATGP